MGKTSPFSRVRTIAAIAALAASLLFECTKAAADPTAPSEATPDALSPGGIFNAYEGWVKGLADKGATFSLRQDSEVWANVTGGGKTGTSYNGLTTAKLDVDLGRLVGWSGAEFVASGFYIHDHGPSRSFLENQQLVSNIEATPSLKLYDLWLDQSVLDGGLSLRVGQEGVNDEFMDTAYGALYLNSSFGFPGMAAAVLPSGGPNYPLATPFARLQWKANDNLTLLGAVYNGDPAPPGPGDPQTRDRNGTAFRLDDHALGIIEAWYSPEPDGPANLPTTYKIGAWYSSDNFADQRYDSAGGLLASPASTGMPLNHRGDWALYGTVDQRVWQPAGADNRGIGVFFQVMGGPGDRNLSNLFVAGGINWIGPFADRASDMFGLAFAYLGISPAARAYSRDLVAFGSATSSYTNSETVIEATYEAPLTGWLTLQPDLQYVIHPNAGIPNNFSSHVLPDALVVGLRFTVRL